MKELKGLRKIFCIRPRKQSKGQLHSLSSIISTFGWVDTTSDLSFRSTVAPTREKFDYDEYTEVRDAKLATKKCDGCKGAVDVVQRQRCQSHEWLDCSVLFTQKPLNKGLAHHVVDISVHALIQEWTDNGYERHLRSKDEAHARYSRYLTTFKCASCMKYQFQIFISVVLQKSEEIGGSLFYLNILSVPGGGSREKVVSTFVPETTSPTPREKELGLYITSP